MSKEEFIKVMEFNGYEEFDGYTSSTSPIKYQSQDHRVLLFYDPDTCEVDAHVDDCGYMSLGWFCTTSFAKLNAFFDVCEVKRLYLFE